MTSPHKPRFLYTAEQSRAVDRCAIEEHGLPGPLLMARAARAAFARLLERVPRPELLQVLCGPGNNGGDGLLLAMLAQGRGIPVRVYLVDGPPRTDDAQRAAARARRAGIAPRRFEAAALEARGVVVDAMLGTGIRGAPRVPGALRNWIFDHVDTGGEVPESGILLGPIRLENGAALAWLSGRRSSPAWEAMSENVHAELRKRFLQEALPQDEIEILLDG